MRMTVILPIHGAVAVLHDIMVPLASAVDSVRKYRLINVLKSQPCTLDPLRGFILPIFASKSKTSEHLTWYNWMIYILTKHYPSKQRIFNTADIVLSFQTRLRRIIWGSRIAREFLVGWNSTGWQVPPEEDCGMERKVLYSPQEPNKASLFLFCWEVWFSSVESVRR